MNTVHEASTEDQDVPEESDSRAIISLKKVRLNLKINVNDPGLIAAKRNFENRWRLFKYMAADNQEKTDMVGEKKQ